MTRPSRNIPAPIIRTVLARIVDPPKELVRILEDAVTKHTTGDAEALRRYFTDIVHEQEREEGKYQAAVHAHEQAIGSIEIRAIAASASMWHADHEARKRKHEAQLATCDRELEAHRDFVRSAPTLLAQREVAQESVDMLRAQLGIVQRALTDAESKLAQFDSSHERYARRDETEQNLLAAREGFDRILKIVEAQKCPYEAPPTAAPPTPPVHKLDPKLCAAILAALGDLE
jgi:hypothetical protein